VRTVPTSISVDVDIYMHSVIDITYIEYRMPDHVKFSVNGFIDACISSSVRPLVSGTNFTTNKIVKQHTPENKKKVPANIHQVHKQVKIYLNSYTKLYTKFLTNVVTMCECVCV